MPDTSRFLLCLLVMAGVTYLIRMLPLVFFRKPIRNRFARSFLHYVPYAALSAMTFPAIFYATSSPLSAVAGLLAALLLAYRSCSLISVAAGACGTVLLCEWAVHLLS
ncbi:AzlD domain-containing protein [Ruminococcus champanellensis]|uniref:AzlD domain-containing protein n=1 Tax=Ruminococcus champanellensis TaxID=1161942 RepID=UPI0023F3EA69|nr:AzlD domain-containing protein [Ruminococcus champanellensis]MED9892364.1 AzlD domain-containing protein [Ruminococcus champanellensis]